MLSVPVFGESRPTFGLALFDRAFEPSDGCEPRPRYPIIAPTRDASALEIRAGRQHVSELLEKSLENSQKEVEAGVADAEAELGRLRQHCERLEELIAIGKATLSAIQLKPSSGTGTAVKAAKAQNGQSGDTSDRVMKHLQSQLT
jgi:hypothetical protein